MINHASRRLVPLALAKQVSDLKAQVADLSLTEANLYAKAQTSLKADNLDAAEATLKKLLERYPNGSNAAAAKNALAGITEKRADKLLGQARWYANDGQFNNAQALYQQMIDKYPHTQAVAGARSGLNDLSTLKAQAAAAEAGFLVSDMSTYWTGSPQSNGQNLIVPEVRFHVRPSAKKPITYLELKAVYFIKKNGSMEQFGSGETWVIGSDDIPLQPGTSKESWIESDTGYVDNGSQVGWDLLAGNGPATRADLYYRTDILGSWTKFESVDVTPRYRF
jgi:tetratricopeptide (TPR) repeat protein